MPVCFVAAPAPEHTAPGHPEHAGRLDAILRELRADPIVNRLTEIDSSPASFEQLSALHTYAGALRAAMSQAPGYVDQDTYITPQSFDCALAAAGAALAAVNAVISNLQSPNTDSARAFALLRPPGHHATPERPMGFCLFNNMALAARHALAAGLERVMIVDFDVHHGNGTQDFFYDSDSVLFLSTHQQGIYPGTGRADETGAGDGRGYTINVPLPSGAGDGAFAQIAESIICPAADRFRPELLLVSAGFDAHWADPLAGLALSSAGYFRLAQSLVRIAEQHCSGRVAFILEGGYDLNALAASVLAVFHALLGDTHAPDPLGPAPGSEPEIRRALDKVRAIHSL